MIRKFQCTEREYTPQYVVLKYHDIRDENTGEYIGTKTYVVNVSEKLQDALECLKSQGDLVDISKDAHYVPELTTNECELYFVFAENNTAYCIEYVDEYDACEWILNNWDFSLCAQDTAE